MQVNIKHDAIIKKNFCDLPVGQVCIYGNDAWMKIVCAADEADDDADDVNAICLADGEHGYFWYEEVIIPEVAVLNIEY